jgi:hypothetical protein
MICLDCLTFENGADMLSETSVTIITRRVIFQKSEDLIYTVDEARNPVYMDVTDSLSMDVTDSLSMDVTDSLSMDVTDSLSMDVTDSLSIDVTDSLSMDVTDSLSIDVIDSLSYIPVNRVKTVRIEKSTAVEQHLSKKRIQTIQNVRHDQPISNCY